jgi:RNA polymerase sigma-70 factor (sigma-E family)
MEFEQFVVDSWPRLRQVAWLLTRDVDDAEDLLQSVLVRACASWSRVSRDDPYAYVRRGLVNGHIDQWRRRRGPIRIESGAPERAVHDAARVEDRSELIVLLGRLTARERATVVLRHYLDLSTAEVAAELGVSTGTVKSTLSRALATLRVAQPTDLSDQPEESRP